MWMHWLKMCLPGIDCGDYGYLPQRMRARHSALLHYSRLR
jgi:hypothetical protein